MNQYVLYFLAGCGAYSIANGTIHMVFVVREVWKLRNRRTLGEEMDERELWDSTWSDERNREK